MDKYITYKRIYEILDLHQKKESKKMDVLDVEYIELEKLGFMYNLNSQIVYGGEIDLDITDKGKSFIHSYQKPIKKMEYFMQDYPFIGALLIGAVGGLIGTIFSGFISIFF